MRDLKSKEIKMLEKKKEEKKVEKKIKSKSEVAKELRKTMSLNEIAAVMAVPRKAIEKLLAQK